MQPYKIKLQNFEGPLDLLLFFVRKDELNIYDIPLARITKSYMEYIQLMHELNLDIAGEFILMAATLMRIKVRMMLPKDPLEDEEEEMLDPREELSRRLIEYRQFKEASKSLHELDEYWRTVYRRSYFNFDLLPQNPEEAFGLKDVSFFDLLAAYKKAMARKGKPIFHTVERLNVTVEEQQKYILDFFQTRTCYLFSDLCEAMGKIEIVVTFLAMLDLIRAGGIAVKQATIFDDIWIYKAEEFLEESGGVLPEEVEGMDVQRLTESDSPMSEVVLPSDDAHEAVGIDLARQDRTEDQMNSETVTVDQTTVSEPTQETESSLTSEQDNLKAHEIPAITETQETVSHRDDQSAADEIDKNENLENLQAADLQIHENSIANDLEKDNSPEIHNTLEPNTERVAETHVDEPSVEMEILVESPTVNAVAEADKKNDVEKTESRGDIRDVDQESTLRSFFMKIVLFVKKIFGK